MRYWIGFVVAVALVAAPLSAYAHEGEESMTTPPAATAPSQQAEPSSSWLRRMHPGAFEAPAKNSDARFEIEYVTPGGPTEEGGRGLSKQGRIAIGVVVPVVLTVVAAAVTASVFSNAGWR